MCFSATASFVTSGVLLGASAVTLAKLKQKPTQLYAFIPLIFAVQQAIEGFQWLALDHGMGSLPMAYAFLFFAYIFWPVFLPLAALQVEKDPTRRLVIGLFAFMGVFAGTVLIATLFTNPPTVSVVGHSIAYGMAVPLYRLVAAFYVLAVCGSGIMVNRPWIQAMGALGFVGLMVSLWAFYAAYGSVWCFFAAVLSICVIMDLRQPVKRK